MRYLFASSTSCQQASSCIGERRGTSKSLPTKQRSRQETTANSSGLRQAFDLSCQVISAGSDARIPAMECLLRHGQMLWDHTDFRDSSLSESNLADLVPCVFRTWRELRSKVCGQLKFALKDGANRPGTQILVEASLGKLVDVSRMHLVQPNPIVATKNLRVRKTSVRQFSTAKAADRRCPVCVRNHLGKQQNLCPAAARVRVRDSALIKRLRLA